MGLQGNATGSWARHVGWLKWAEAGLVLMREPADQAVLVNWAAVAPPQQVADASGELPGAWSACSMFQVWQGRWGPVLGRDDDDPMAAAQILGLHVSPGEGKGLGQSVRGHVLLGGLPADTPVPEGKGMHQEPGSPELCFW